MRPGPVVEGVAGDEIPGESKEPIDPVPARVDPL
jgi:hypothetical protein